MSRRNGGIKVGRGERINLKINLLKCHFFQHESSHFKFHGTEPGTPR
jgi:hypothetical protein